MRLANRPGGPILLLVLLMLVLSGLSAPAVTAETRVEVLARQFEFVPGRITAQVGQPLTLVFRTEDVVHGAYIDGQGVDIVIEPGKEVVVTIVPTTVGKFKIRCSVTCGPLHPFMVGELVVEDQGINPVFLGSLASVLGVGLAATALVLRRHPHGPGSGEE